MKAATEAPTEEPRTVSGTDPAVRAASVSHSYGTLAVLDAIDLDAGDGEVVGLVGPSGCGKSTLLELIAGLLEPTAGELEVAGEADPERRLTRCAYQRVYPAWPDITAGILRAGEYHLAVGLRRRVQRGDRLA